MNEYLDRLQTSISSLTKSCENIQGAERKIAHALRELDIEEATEENPDRVPFIKLMKGETGTVNSNISYARYSIQAAIKILNLLNDSLNERLPKEKQVSFTDIVNKINQPVS